MKVMLKKSIKLLKTDLILTYLIKTVCEFYSFLLTKGAKKEILDSKGRTALAIAIRTGKNKAVKL